MRAKWSRLRVSRTDPAVGQTNARDQVVGHPDPVSRGLHLTPDRGAQPMRPSLGRRVGQVHAQVRHRGVSPPQKIWPRVPVGQRRRRGRQRQGGRLHSAGTVYARPSRRASWRAEKWDDLPLPSNENMRNITQTAQPWSTTFGRWSCSRNAGTGPRRRRRHQPVGSASHRQ